MKTLFPYQRKVADWATNRERIALFLEMRLGKTLVTIRWLRQVGARRILVVAPLTVLASWESELAEEGIRSVLLRGNRSAKWKMATQPRYGWFLVNYEGLRAAPELTAIKWDAVIADESTRIKNPQAQITKLLTRRLDHVRWRAILSGLPNPEGPMDYFTQAVFLQNEFMGTANFWKWRERYFHQYGYDWVPKKGTLHAIRQALNTFSYFLSRREVNVGGKKVFEQRAVDPTPDQRHHFQTLRKDFTVEDLETKFSVVQATWMARLAGGFLPKNPTTGEPGALLTDRKFVELATLLQTELKKVPVIVWFRFNQELNYAYSFLKKKDLRVSRITGITSQPDREYRRRRFQKGAYDALLIQVKIGRMGLDLSYADTAIYYSNSYAYEDRRQSEDRIVHPTRSSPLLILDLVTRGTVDEDILELLRDKSITAQLFQTKLLERLRERMKEGYFMKRT